MGQCFASSRNELSKREQRNDLQRARNQIADLQRELRAQREKSREQMNCLPWGISWVRCRCQRNVPGYYVQLSQRSVRARG